VVSLGRFRQSDEPVENVQRGGQPPAPTPPSTSSTTMRTRTREGVPASSLVTCVPHKCRLHCRRSAAGLGGTATRLLPSVEALVGAFALFRALSCAVYKTETRLGPGTRPLDLGSGGGRETAGQRHRVIALSSRTGRTGARLEESLGALSQLRGGFDTKSKCARRAYPAESWLRATGQPPLVPRIATRWLPPPGRVAGGTVGRLHPPPGRVHLTLRLEEVAHEQP
jgi:hypothetical protein